MHMPTFRGLLLLVFACLCAGDGREAPEGPPFGRRMREYFMMAENYTNLNHGSFGSVPRAVIEARRRYEDECEARPDPFFRGGYAVYLERNRAALASYIKANGEDLVFVENASVGVNAVLRSLRIQTGDVIVQLSSAYNMVKNTLSYLSTFEGLQVVTVPVVFPGKGLPPTGTMKQTLLEAIETALSQHPSCKLLVISHIISVPAAILPVAEVAQLCDRYGVPTLVDGAHALGHIPIDIAALSASGVDFWVGNGHKWLYSPKGTAILWTRPDLQGGVVPTVISSEYGPTYLERFEYTGTRDYSAFCALGAALEWRAEMGEEAILEWNVELAHWGERYLAGLWESEVLLPEEMTGMMSHPRLPAAVESVGQMKWLAAALLSDYGIYAVLFDLVNPETGEESFWVRLSAQIYLEQADIITFGNAVLELIPKMPPAVPIII